MQHGCSAVLGPGCSSGSFALAGAASTTHVARIRCVGDCSGSARLAFDNQLCHFPAKHRQCCNGQAAMGSGSCSILFLRLNISSVGDGGGKPADWAKCSLH